MRQTAVRDTQPQDPQRSGGSGLRKGHRGPKGHAAARAKLDPRNRRSHSWPGRRKPEEPSHTAQLGAVVTYNQPQGTGSTRQSQEKQNHQQGSPGPAGPTASPPTFPKTLSFQHLDKQIPLVDMETSLALRCGMFRSGPTPSPAFLSPFCHLSFDPASQWLRAPLSSPQSRGAGAGTWAVGVPLASCSLPGAPQRRTVSLCLELPCCRGCHCMSTVPQGWELTGRNTDRRDEVAAVNTTALRRRCGDLVKVQRSSCWTGLTELPRAPSSANRSPISLTTRKQACFTCVIYSVPQPGHN